MVRPSPSAWTMTGFKSISAILSAWSAAKRDSAAISSRQGGAVGRRLAAHAVEQGRAFQLAEQPQRFLGAERHRGEGDVLQYLDMDAAEPDHQDRAEIGVAW